MRNDRLIAASVIMAGGIGAGVFGFHAGTECSGPFGNLAVVFGFLVALLVAAVLGVMALVSAALRYRSLALSTLALAGAIVIGFYVGARIGAEAPSRCPQGPPDTVTEVAGTAVATLPAPWNVAVAGSVACSVDIATGVAFALHGTLEATDGSVAMELWGVPGAVSPSDGFDQIDLIILDESLRPAPGYRARSAAHIEVEPGGPLFGVTRLLGVPLLEDTRPDGAVVPDRLDAQIEWRCEPLPSS